MSVLPEGWPRIASAIYYEDARAAIDWLCRAFGFETRLKIEGDDGAIHHSELVYGPPGSEGVVMVAAANRREAGKSPRALGGANTQSMMMYVDDVDAHCQRARAEGAKILVAPEVHDYGDAWWADRTYEAEDCEGHRWWFSQRVKTGKKKS